MVVKRSGGSVTGTAATAATGTAATAALASTAATAATATASAAGCGNGGHFENCIQVDSSFVQMNASGDSGSFQLLV